MNVSFVIPAYSAQKVLQTLIRAAANEIVVALDSHEQHDPKELPRLFTQISEYEMIALRTNRSSTAPSCVCLKSGSSAGLQTFALGQRFQTSIAA